MQHFQTPPIAHRHQPNHQHLQHLQHLAPRAERGLCVQPNTIQLLGLHVLRTRDVSTAGGCAAEAGEALCHVPFGGSDQWWENDHEQFHVGLGHLASWGQPIHYQRELADLLAARRYALSPLAHVYQTEDPADAGVTLSVRELCDKKTFSSADECFDLKSNDPRKSFYALAYLSEDFAVGLGSSIGGGEQDEQADQEDRMHFACRGLVVQ